jgi:predicted AAA+ superfamily ATPase
MDILIEDYRRLLNDLGEVYQRNIYQSLESDHRIIGIVGPRGIGKTTYILTYLKENYFNNPQALYVSADDLYFSENTLLEVARKFIDRYDGRLLCIDEIHKYPNWGQELKNIFDKYKKLKIIFSGSSSIDLIREKYDLSRRAILKHMPGMSFREFLEIKTGHEFPIISLDEIVENGMNISTEVASTPKLIGWFNEYLQIGYYPLFNTYNNHDDIYQALIGIIEKCIYIDIPSYYRIKSSTIPVFKKILNFIYSSSPSSINVNRIAKSLKKDHSDVTRYLEMLRDSGLLRFLLIDKTGHALMRNAEKVFLNNTNLFYAMEHELGKGMDKGAVRELFALTCLENSNLKPAYSKTGDLQCRDFLFEIGGRNKSTKQIRGQKNSFLILDDILIGTEQRIPLYLLGFLY